jgi:predicted RNase H-like HicB family nuclease
MTQSAKSSPGEIEDVVFADFSCVPRQNEGGRRSAHIPSRIKTLESDSPLNYAAPMKYSVILIPSDEGFAVSCPALPGCWSQGKTQDEALANIREAIQLWLEVAVEDARSEAGREAGMLAEVTV